MKKIEDHNSPSNEIAPEPSVQSVPNDSYLNTISSPSVAAQLSEEKLIRKNLRIQNSDSKDGDDELSHEVSPSEDHHEFEGNNYHEGFPDWSTAAKLPEKRQPLGQPKDWEVILKGGNGMVYRLPSDQNLLTDYFMSDKRFYDEGDHEQPSQTTCTNCGALLRQKNEAPSKLKGLRTQQESSYRNLGYDIGLRDMTTKLNELDKICRCEEEAKGGINQGLGREDFESIKVAPTKEKITQTINFRQPFKVKVSDPQAKAKESKKGSRSTHDSKENTEISKSQEGVQKGPDDLAKGNCEHAHESKHKLRKLSVFSYKNAGTQCPHEKSAREKTITQYMTTKSK